MKTGKIVLFDIDNTLFDTTNFRQRLYTTVAQALSSDIDSINEIGQRVITECIGEFGFFDPHVFALRLALELNRKKDVALIEQAILDKRNFENGLYEESFGVVADVSKEATIGIFSRGYTEFQEKKIVGLRHLLAQEHVHITINKHETLPSLIAKYKEKTLYLVDDALDVLYTAWKLRKDVVTILVKRGKYALSQEPIPGFTPSVVITNLKEAVSVIRGI